ncbi:GNAT family N-acetyltransferase [Vagococcus sp. PNs007]|uniref:GNAT family N-acetyltransferase n=1 Tax=Vagococcus proximus TaxID=2991417 RepID=A0ABT5X2T9_9ENTE|nr:GNAT family N-acetyltransferase [Vagococcus proximus]MDF0480283.1 GNAT family N-acetyltransferase [Vagococcus proximus]
MKAINFNEVSLTESVELWNDCFSDYPTPMVMTNDTLTARFNKFGLSEELSFIMKDEEKLLGLILIGVREFDGIVTAWVGGMGVRPSERHSGVAKAMLSKMEERVKVSGVEVIKFEVLSENLKAKYLYLDKGYSIITDLGIYQGVFSKIRESAICIEMSKGQSDPQNTPWQNRSVFNKSFDFILNHKKIGDLVLDEVYDKEGNRSLVMRQFRLPTCYLEQALSSLHKKYGEISMTWSNFDEADIVTQALTDCGFIKTNSQFQLKKYI